MILHSVKLQNTISHSIRIMHEFMYVSCTFFPHHVSGTITKVKKSKNLGEKKRKKNDRLKEISWKKRSVSDPHTQTESLQVESQLCLWFMNFTHFARSHLRVIQVLQTNQAGHDKLLLIVSHQHLLCQQVLQTIGSDMKNSHNLTPSLPASPAAVSYTHLTLPTILSV